MRSKAVFPPKICARCGIDFTPNGPTTLFCNTCRVIADKERKRKWYIENVPNAFSRPVSKKYTEICKVCGNMFYASYNGISCCQKHYNIAYRTGDPFTPEGKPNTNSFRKYNNYMIGTTKSGVEYLFDKEDYQLISKYSWCISKTGYLVANINHRVIKLHRYILNAPANAVVDHINGNHIDNRRENLRLTTRLGNSRNSTVSKSNIVKHLGISPCPNGKFRARIMVHGKEINLGRFVDINDAIKARREAEIKYFGEYAPSLCKP